MALPEYESIFVARQPIFTKDQQIWGYELLFRHSGDSTCAKVDDENVATSKVIADGITLAIQGVEKDKRFLINFPSQFLLDDRALALPKQRCVVEILETVDPTPEMVAACKRIKDAGYTLALDDYVGQPGFEPILELVDIIKIDVLGLPPGNITKLAQQHSHPHVKLLAEKVEDNDVFELTRDLGFCYFQGYFFSKPQIVPGRKISSSQLAKVQLLNTLANPECDFEELAQIIRNDLSFSYRLMKFINSSFFSLPTKIDSVQQAITLLGLNPFRQWAQVIALSDMDATPKGKEVTLTSLQRGRFLELLAQEINLAPHPPNTMFMLGLFSSLDFLLGMEMDQILDDMPLQEEIKQALCDTPSPTHDWLQLARTIDQGQFSTTKTLIDKLTLPTPLCALTNHKAWTWSRETLGQL